MSDISVFRQVLEMEARALEKSIERISEANIEKLKGIFENLQKTGGSLVFCGVGKSGIIAKKCAATFSSLGLSSFFLHPVEALHGDLGQVNSLDAVVFISKSGTTEEILKLLPYLPVERDYRIALLGKTESTIAKECDVIFDCSVDKEACINNQAPTTSSTLALAMGDAMAVFYESMVGLSKEKFAVNHPGGFLGKSLRLKVKDIMLEAKDCPVAFVDETLKDVVLKMTDMPVGGCVVLDNDNFLGIIVEGDIRRSLTASDASLDQKVSDVMNTKPHMIDSESLAFDAMKLMEGQRKKLNILPVVDGNTFKGFLRVHDLLKEGLGA